MLSDWSIHVTSDPKRSLTAPELVRQLKKYLVLFENAIIAENKRPRAVVKTK